MTQRLMHGVDEAAELLAISRTRLYGYISSGELESVKLGCRRLVPHSALEDLVERLRAPEPDRVPG